MNEVMSCQDVAISQIRQISRQQINHGRNDVTMRDSTIVIYMYLLTAYIPPGAPVSLTLGRARRCQETLRSPAILNLETRASLPVSRRH